MKNKTRQQLLWKELLKRSSQSKPRLIKDSEAVKIYEGPFKDPRLIRGIEKVVTTNSLIFEGDWAQIEISKTGIFEDENKEK